MKKLPYAGIVLLVLAACLAGLAACPTDVEIKRPVTNIDGLKEKLDEAKALRDSVASAGDGNDIDMNDFWVLPEFHSVLVEKITAAEDEVIRLAAAPYEKITAGVVNELIAAMDDVEKNKKPGLIGANMISIRGTIAGTAWGQIGIYTDAACATVPIGSSSVNKKTEWEARIDKAHTGQTVYARLSFIKNTTTTFYSNIATIAAIPETGVTGIALTLNTNGEYLFDEKVNIAPRATATASNGTETAGNANDNNLTTIWDSTSNPTQITTNPLTLDLDFIVPVQVNYIRLRNKGAAAPNGTIVKFKVNYDDNGDWVTIHDESSRTASISGGPTAETAYGFVLPRVVTSSKLRLQVLSSIIRNEITTVQLFEIETFLIPDRAVLQTKITDAKTLAQDAVVSSQEGIDILSGDTWVSPAQKDNLNAAILTAEAVYSDFEKSASEVSGAVTSLSTVMSGFTGQTGKKSRPPTATTTTVVRNGGNAITFTLTSSHVANSQWKVYRQALGGTVSSITGAFNSSILTITSTSSLVAGDYYVSVIDPEANMVESSRLKLTIAAASGETALPVVTENVYISKTAITPVTFTLTTVYANTVTWAVFTDENLANSAVDVTVSSNGTTLTLEKIVGGVPFGTYWLTAHESGLASASAPLKLIIAEPYTLLSAEVDPAQSSNKVLKVTFNGDINASSLEISRFVVKVNEYPTYNYNSASNPTKKPWLDFSMKAQRTITHGSVSGNVLSLTMNEPAKHGEILRLATLEAGAITSTGGKVLPGISSGLIIKNLVPRVKHSCENTPGFYKVSPSGVAEQLIPTEATGTTVWYKALEYFYRTQNPQNGYTYYIVIGENQTPYTTVTNTGGIGAWWGIGTGNGGFSYAGTQRATIILTTNQVYETNKLIKMTAGTTDVIYTSGGGVDFIMDGSVTIENDATTGECFIIGTGDGGRFILDKGIIRGRTQTYARGNIGMPSDLNYGVYIIINGGELSGMKSMLSTVALGANSIFVMHGGEIKNNTATKNAENMENTLKAGAVGIRPSGQTGNNYGGSLTTRQHGSIGFYMTGGTISGNTTNVGNHSASGAVLSAGEFQKTGGSLSENAINGGTSVYNKAKNFVVLKTAGASPAGTNPAAGNSYINDDATVDESTMLILECEKTEAGTAATFRKPLWADGTFTGD